MPGSDLRAFSLAARTSQRLIWRWSLALDGVEDEALDFVGLGPDLQTGRGMEREVVSQEMQSRRSCRLIFLDMRRFELLDIADGFAIDEAWKAAFKPVEGLLMSDGRVTRNFEREKLHPHVAVENIGAIRLGLGPCDQ